MRKTTRTFVEVEEWIKRRCDICYGEPPPSSTHTLNIRNIETNVLISRTYLCLECKAKIENNQFKECRICENILKRGERLVGCCFCCEFEKKEEKGKIRVESHAVKLEKQLYKLNLEHKQLEKDHVEGIEATMEATANWYKREHEKEKEELTDRIKNIEGENSNLKKRITELELENAKLKEDIQYQMNYSHLILSDLKMGIS